MIEIITKWNLTSPHEVVTDFIESITLRGYSTDAQLPGEFLLLLQEEKIRPLSVGYISDNICPSRRDLYFQKGVNKAKGIKDSKTWGREAGKVVENFFYDIGTHGHKTEKDHHDYSKLSDLSNDVAKKYFSAKQDSFNTLVELENSLGANTGDTEWLKKILNYSGRAELAHHLLNSVLQQDGALAFKHIEIQKDINPKIEIGINAPTQPDFLIPEFKIAGDIKTGDRFKDMYQLTCTGYALAYESETGRDVNWGIIYFIPTRNASRYARIINYPQIHIFPINQSMRQWFLDTRDSAYSIISKTKEPQFPINKENCKYCKYINHCVDNGLVI